MRFIFTDESSTTKSDPFIFVAAIIVDPDAQLLALEKQIETTIFRHVPDAVRRMKPFVFHATHVLNDKCYREGDIWPLPDRLKLLNAMAALPRQLGIPIAVGTTRRDVEYKLPLNGWTQEEMRHHFAFVDCLERCDHHIRTRARAEDLGFVIAEETQRSAVLAVAPHHMRRPHEVDTLPSREQALQGMRPGRHTVRNERIRDSILFVKKDQELATWLADACAFAFRRYFLNLQFGDELMTSMLGGLLDKDDWATESSCSVWHFD